MALPEVVDTGSITKGSPLALVPVVTLPLVLHVVIEPGSTKLIVAFMFANAQFPGATYVLSAPAEFSQAPLTLELTTKCVKLVPQLKFALLARFPPK